MSNDLFPAGLIGARITSFGMNQAGEIFMTTDTAGEFVITKDEHGAVALYEVLRRPPAPPPGPNWSEDLTAPGGIYQCRCSSCGCTFFGAKRRPTCKTCAHKANG